MPIFTKEMKKTHTILIPSMAPIHFGFFDKILEQSGYNIAILDNVGPNVVSEGLKFVHNDTCYPALLVIGQMIDALNSGKYDPKKVALAMTQTGGGCRASNYIHLLRKAIDKAGYDYIPVLSLNMSGLEKSAFKITFPMIRRVFAGLIYGDLIMLLKNQIEPYEIKQKACSDLVIKWTDILTKQFSINKGFKAKEIKNNLLAIANDFSLVEIEKKPKVKVGIVGEIYVKYAALANNDLENFLVSQDCEINVPGILNFVLYCIDTRIDDINLYGGSKIKKFIITLLLRYALKMEEYMLDAVKAHPSFMVPSSFLHTKFLVKNVIGYGNKMGEGWLLTSEMVELVESGFENIICAQPFGCLPNHICGKGMIRKIKGMHDNANIVPIDYDPSATKVNQENRIKLMLSIAKENLK